MFLILIAKKNDTNNSVFWKNIANREVWIEEINGPVDLENLENIINCNDWSPESINKIIEQFHLLGMKISIETKGNQIFLKVFGPDTVIDKKKGNDSLGLGDTKNKKFSQSELFSSISNGFDNFPNSLQLFVFSYFISTGKKINIVNKTPNKYRTQIDIQEEQSVISFIINDFIDVNNKKLINQIFHEIHSKSLSKTENIFLKLIGNIFGDSSHFLNNLGKKDKKAVILVLESLGYVNSKFLHKAVIYNLKPNYSVINAGIIYSLSLGKKSSLKDVIIFGDNINNSVKNELKIYILKKYKKNKDLFSNLEEFNKCLKPFKINCFKKRTLNISDQQFNIQLWCDYNNVEKFFQNIKFNHFPCAYELLYNLANDNEIAIGAPVIENNLNEFTKNLEQITGRKIKFQHQMDKGMIATFVAGEKPPLYKKVDTFLRANPTEGLVISFFQFQFFLIYNLLFKVTIIPEISTEITNGVKNVLEKLKIGPKIELEYYTKNNINISFVLQGMLKIKESIKYLYESPDSITNFESKLNIKKGDNSFFINISNNDSENLKYLFERSYQSFIFKNNIKHFTYLFSTGFETEIDISKDEKLSKVITAVKGFIPLALNSWKFSNIGLRLEAKYTNANYYLGVLVLSNFILAFAPLKTNESLLATYGEFRIPGEPKIRISQSLCLYRFALMREIWDSSEIFVKMFSLMVGVIANVGFLYDFKNINSLCQNQLRLKYIGNTGFIIMLDLMGSLSFFISITFDYRGKLCFDLGIVYSMNSFAKNQLIQSMS